MAIEIIKQDHEIEAMIKSIDDYKDIKKFTIFVMSFEDVDFATIYIHYGEQSYMVEDKFGETEISTARTITEIHNECLRIKEILREIVKDCEVYSEMVLFGGMGIVGSDN